MNLFPTINSSWQLNNLALSGDNVVTDALSELFSGRDEAVYYTPSPSTCFTDTGGTTPAAVGDTVAFMTDNFGNMDSVWTVETTRPTLRQDGDGRYYLELSDGAHAASQTNALDFTDTDFGAIMVALRDDAQSALSTLVSTQGTSPARYVGLMNTGSGSASATLNSSSVGTIHINDGSDLEADGTTRAELVAEFEGALGVMSGRGLDPDTVENNWAFYTYLASAAPTGRFYMGLVVPGMTEVERASAVTTASTEYGVGAVAPDAFAVGDWRIDWPYDDQVDIVIDNVPAGTTDIQLQLDDGALTSLGAATADTYVVSGLTVGQLYRARLYASNGTVSEASDVKLFKPFPFDDEHGFRGADPTEDFGVIADYYFDPINGDDTNAGTSSAAAKETAAAALALASTGDTVMMLRGVERGQVSIPDGVTLERYGTDMARVTGMQPLSLTQCTAGDSGAIGGTLGIADSPVYKATIAKTDVAHGAEVGGLQLYVQGEGSGQRINNISDRANTDRLEQRTLVSDFLLADGAGNGFGVDGSNKVITITDSNEITSAKYADADLVGKWVYLKNHPNQTKLDLITAADVATNTITLAGTWTVQGNGTPDADSYLYTIENSAGDQLIPGTYYVEDDGTDLTIYVYPEHEDHVPFVEYTAEEGAILFDTGVSSAGVRGLILNGASGTSNSSTTGSVVKKAGDGTTERTAITIEQNFIYGATNTDNESASPGRGIRVDDTADLTVKNNTIFDIIGQGVSTSGDSANNADDQWIAQNIFEDTSFDAISDFFQVRGAVTHNRFTRCCTDTHGSLVKRYGTSGALNNEYFAIWGNEFRDDNGAKIQWQRTSYVTVGFNLIQDFTVEGASEEAKLHDGNDSAGNQGPVAGATLRIMNNTFRPKQVDDTFVGFVTSLDKHSGGNDTQLEMQNNIGGAFQDPPRFTGETVMVKFAGNLVSKLSSGFTQLVSSFTNFDPRNLIKSDRDDVFTDADTGDYSLTAEALEYPGVDLSADVVAIKAEYPRVPSTVFDRDVFYNVIDWTDLPVGADTTVAFDRTTVPPELSAPVGVDSGATGATRGVTTDTASGTLYYGSWPTSAPPTPGDIVLGTGGVDTASVTVTATGVQTIADATGLTTDTEYQNWYIHENTDGHFAEPANSAAFTPVSAGASPAFVQGATVIEESDYEAGPHTFSGTYTPNSSANDLVFAVTYDSLEAYVAPTWRGVAMTALAQFTHPENGKRVQLFTVAAGSGIGTLALDVPTGEDVNSIVADVAEFSDMLTTLVGSAQTFHDADTVATSGATDTGLFTGLTSGNALVYVHFYGGEPDSITAAGVGNDASDSDTGASDASDTVQLLAYDLDGSGDVTIGATTTGDTREYGILAIELGA